MQSQIAASPKASPIFAALAAKHGPVYASALAACAYWYDAACRRENTALARMWLKQYTRIVLTLEAGYGQ